MHEQGVIILLKDAGAYFYRNISSNYRRVQYVAEKLGATIRVDNKQCDETTVAIILYDNSHAAWRSTCRCFCFFQTEISNDRAA